jgi:hypothetical protein
MNVAPALNISHILPNAKICLEDACSLCEVLRFSPNLCNICRKRGSTRSKPVALLLSDMGCHENA